MNQNNNMRVTGSRTYLRALAFAVVVLAFVGVVSMAVESPQESSRAVESGAVTLINPFDTVSLEAEAAYVFDVARQEILFEKNKEAQLPLASLTKLMTVLVVSELLPASTAVVIDSDALAQEGDSGFLIGEKWRVKDLIDFTLVESSNDGANALASVAGARLQATDNPEANTDTFVGKMNETAQKLGLSQTYFLNETGLDNGDVISGGYGSARDIAHLFEHILTAVPELIEATRYPVLTFSSLTNVEHTAENTNNGLTNVPGLIGSKTGFTDLAGGNLVIAFDAGIGHPIVAAVLGSTIDGRFTDIEQLVWASLERIVQPRTSTDSN